MNVYGLDLSYNMVEIALEKLSGIGGDKRVRIMPAFYVHIYLTGMFNILRKCYNGHSNHNPSSYVSCHMLILYETTPLRIVCHQ